MLTVDKLPADDAPLHKRREALAIYRKITTLQCVPCCGMCGSARHQTKPYWCLGMRICRHCIQANLVSSTVLYERFWVTFGQPVQSYRNFVDAVAGNVFYFSTRLTAHQRLEFSCDKVDFPGGMRTSWFFWRPHLAQILNMEKLEREGREKHTASGVIRAWARRALILRAMNHTTDRTLPTLLPFHSFSRRDLRVVLFRLHKAALLDKVDIYHERRMLCHLPGDLYKRLQQNEDRVAPFMFN
jgi:hypothetical protein